MIVVVGAGGTEAYAEDFRESADRLSHLGEEAKLAVQVIGFDAASQQSDRQRLQSALQEAIVNSPQQLWLVFIGHGTFNGTEAKFNLRGPDLKASELAEWISDVESKLIVVNCSSSSAPFINALSAENRIIVTSTQSGFEQNYSRFAHFFCDSLAAEAADLDKDQQTSLLESFLYASRQVDAFYESEGRLVTEHALIDDNGDQLGTSTDWFEGVRVTRHLPGDKLPDGMVAHQIHLKPSRLDANWTAEQRELRDGLELQLERIRRRRSELEDHEYYAQVEEVVTQLAVLYVPEDASASTGGDGDTSDAADPQMDDGGNRWVQLPEPNVQPPRPVKTSPR